MNINTCIFCTAAANLNTQMTITNDDGTKVAVKICDEHAEEATVKSAREAYNNRLAQIKAVMDQAKALGLNIGGGLVIEEDKSGLAIVSSVPSKDISTKPQTAIMLDKSDPNVIPTNRLNSREFRSVAGAVGGASLESHNKYDTGNLADKLDPSVLDGYAQMTINEGRTGQQIAIPAIRQDKTGTTTITIKKSENDATLQARTKRLAQASMNDENMSYKDGYAGHRPCPLCRGVGFINTGKAKPICPKCNGVGNIVSV